MTYTNRKHKWRKPPAGTASSRDQVCGVCGIRKSACTKDECDGANRDAAIETVSDYEPVE